MSATEMPHVDPRTLSDGVKPGDRIEFWVESKTYKIRDIKVIERTNDFHSAPIDPASVPA